MVATIRVIADEVRRRGIDPRLLLAAHGLDRQPLWSPFSRAPRGAILCFTEDCLSAASDPALHVVATANAEVGAFQMADYLGLMAPSWGTGCRAVMERFHLVNGGCAFQIEEHGAGVSCRFYSVYETAPHPLEVEATFVAFDGRMRIATGGEHGLVRLEFAHQDHGAGDLLRDTLGCSVAYGQAENRVHMGLEGWRFKPSFFDVAGRSILEAAVAPFESALTNDDVVRSVRTAVAQAVTQGKANVSAVARYLGMSNRSLQRHLAAQGSTFAEMVDQERSRQAARRMSEPGARASEVGQSLGFSEPSAFARAFRRWTGLSPTEYAEKHQARGPWPKLPPSE